MSNAISVTASRRLSGNLLKLIAAISMLCDHAGLLFFPHMAIFRAIGRLALPIFAFMIAEGCHFTKNRLRYFLGIFLLGAVCQAVYFVFTRSMYMNILLTFSGSIVIVYLLQTWKARQKHLWMVPFAAAIAAAYVLCQYVELDYGFWGMMIPVFVSVAYPRRGERIGKAHHLLRIIALTLALIPSCMEDLPLRLFSFAAVPLLLFYSGKRGKGNFKYAFYLFYPAHLAALQVIAWLLA